MGGRQIGVGAAQLVVARPQRGLVAPPLLDEVARHQRRDEQEGGAEEERQIDRRGGDQAHGGVDRDEEAGRRQRRPVAEAHRDREDVHEEEEAERGLEAAAQHHQHGDVQEPIADRRQDAEPVQTQAAPDRALDGEVEGRGERQDRVGADPRPRLEVDQPEDRRDQQDADPADDDEAPLQPQARR